MCTRQGGVHRGIAERRASRVGMVAEDIAIATVRTMAKPQLKLSVGVIGARGCDQVEMCHARYANSTDQTPRCLRVYGSPPHTRTMRIVKVSCLADMVRSAHSG